MLDDLLHGVEKSQFVLITDAHECPARILFLNWLKSLASRLDSVVLICLERQPEFFLSWLPASLQGRVRFVDGNKYSDGFQGLGEDLFKLANLSGVKGQTAVLIDSLSLHILTQQTPTVCSSLHRLSSDKLMCQVVAVLHRDVHDQQVCSLLEHIATSVVSLQARSSDTRVCHIRHCRPTGKVFRTVESFTIDESFNVKNIKPYITPSQSSKTSHDQPEVDPMSQLPFNLSLTDSEKVARSQVVLPHLRTDTGEGDAASSQGRIHYEPDDADDLDEEDPDDDLNI